MKSHHISFVPIVEELISRGHEVTFMIPNTDEAKAWFPKGISTAKMMPVGKNDWSVGSLKTPDTANMPLWKQVVATGDALWNYRSLIERPFFFMKEDVEEFLRTTQVDAAVVAGMSFAIFPALEAAGVPVIAFNSFPSIPLTLAEDSAAMCRFPTSMRPYAVSDLKASFGLRVANTMICHFLGAYEFFAVREIQAVMRSRGLDVDAMKSFKDLMLGAPTVVQLSGPPFSLNFRIPEKVHLVGAVGRPESRPIPADLLAWLDAATAAATPVMYVSMGTKYDFTPARGAELVKAMTHAMSGLGLRILWSLRKHQQEVLRQVLPEIRDDLRIEGFTPQPEVLAHPSVKIFLTHCGFGGVTDTLAAGVPSLAYPSFSDQPSNAARLVDLHAGLLLQTDFSNLADSAERILGDPTFAANAKEVGEGLRRLGGLDRTMDIIDHVAAGRAVQADASHKAMSDVDPFFDTPQTMEVGTAVAIWLTVLLALLWILWRCARFCCWCCCGGRAQARDVKEKRKKA